MQTVLLKVTSAIVIAGDIISPAKPGKPPKLAEVTKSEAKDLLRRGKAVLATDEDVRAAGVTASSGIRESLLHPVIEAHQQDLEEQEAERQAEAQGAKDNSQQQSAGSDDASQQGSRDAQDVASATSKSGATIAAATDAAAVAANPRPRRSKAK